MDIAKKLGERIRNIRKEKDWSQEKLGEIAGLHTNYVGQIERGEKNLTIESIEKICNGLNISLEELFRFIDPMDQVDELHQLLDILSQRSSSDRTLVLKIVKEIFDWEQGKNP
jgi:XRE family transcriptional regulator, regulator of sulfur utilization